MYVLIHNERVLVGPMKWNRGIFQGSLEKEGLQVVLPRVAPNKLPHIIASNTVVKRAYTTTPEFDSRIRGTSGPYWNLEGDEAVGEYRVRDLPLEIAKSNMKSFIAGERWKKANEVPVIMTIQGKEVGFYPTAEQRAIFNDKLATMGEDLNWKFSQVSVTNTVTNEEGVEEQETIEYPQTWIKITKAELQSMINSSATHVQNAFDEESVKSAQIDAATSIEELEAL